MLIYPDARDLINLVRNDDPLPVSELRTILESNNSHIVLSFENVCEVIVVDDPVETRRRIGLLQTLPACYMVALTKLRCLELKKAIDDWNRKRPTLAHPFVAYWEETFGYPHINLIGYSLMDVVMHLLHVNPDQFRKTQKDTDFLVTAVSQDRTAADRERRSTQRFVNAILEGLRRCGLLGEVEDPNGFAFSVTEAPTRCPSLWFFHQFYLEYTGNVGASIDPGDYLDLSHASRVPYVDALTLDRRMKNYGEQAIRKITKYGIDYSGRLFPNLAQVITVLR